MKKRIKISKFLLAFILGTVLSTNFASADVVQNNKNIIQNKSLSYNISPPNNTVIKPKMRGMTTGYAARTVIAGNEETLEAIFSDLNEPTLDGSLYVTSSGSIGTLKADFTGNKHRYGGGIYNVGTITSILNSQFKNNSASRSGAIENNATIGTIGSAVSKVLFENNSTTSMGGGAIRNQANGVITNIYADFIGNISATDGGAIHNNGTISAITGNFMNNSAVRGGLFIMRGQ